MMKDDDTGQRTLPEYSCNPFISRLPELRDLREVEQGFDRPPLHDEADRTMAPMHRQHACLRLLNYSQPTISARQIGIKIDMMIRQGYIGRNPTETEWMRFATFCAELESKAKEDHKGGSKTGGRTGDRVLQNLAPMTDTSMSLLVIGPPGMGKTHAVTTNLAHYPQVISHLEPFQVAQITYLHIEAPPDGSLVTLCRFFFAAVDEALQKAGYKSDIEKEYRTKPLSVLLTGMARVANLHAIGILIIDEIQHVGAKRKEDNALLNYLVALRNSIGISILMIGTMAAQSVLQRTLRDARRADGFGSIVLSRMGENIDSTDPSSGAPIPIAETVVRPIYGKQFEGFARRMWRWQYTNTHTAISTEIMNALYEETQGITDLLVKLFMLCQMQLMMITSDRDDNVETITPALIKKVAEENFNIVRPFVAAIRNNDLKALREFEDIIGSGQWFFDQVQGLGVPEVEKQHDYGHGVATLPPMVTEDGIDLMAVNQILQGFGVAAKEREAIVARHRQLIETGDLAGLVTVISKELAALKAKNKLGKEKLKEQPLTGEDDLRSMLSDVETVEQVGRAVGAPSLEEAIL